MIVTQLIGGIGNQMFQYAAGRALSLHHGVPLLIDKSYLDKDTNGAFTKRNYELSCFKIEEFFATEKDLEFFSENSSKIKRIKDRLLPGLSSKITFYESGHKFHSHFFDLPSNSYLKGFWQSEKYFLKFSEQIRADFTLKNAIPADLKQIHSEITNSDSISVHIRRGDYVNLKSAADFHGSPGLDYYMNAVAKLKNTGSKVFVFSDDIAWCRENLSFDVPVQFIDQKNGAEWDLWLMSQCKKNIIANSSFSWWAGWLNNNSGKRVIIPEFWFKGTKSESIDIVAKGWEIS